MSKFEPIALEKLRAQFWDASFVLAGHHSQCMGFHLNFQHDFDLKNMRIAWAYLDGARRFVAKIKPQYLTGDKKMCVDRLDSLITEAYCKIALKTAGTGVTYRASSAMKEPVVVADINDEFLF